MEPSPGRNTATLYVASALLGIALLTTVILVMLLVLRPATAMTIAVGTAQPTECPPGSGAPACFQFDITNTGGRNGIASCIVTPAARTNASFLNGSTVLEFPLTGGEVQQVYAKVTPSGGGDTALAPIVICRPA
jgi:hypothetical protein